MLNRMRLPLRAAAFAAATALSAGSASAFEIFGMTFFEDEQAAYAEAVIADPQPYSATLATTGASDIEAALQAASELFTAQDLPASGAAGLIARARGDYRRITAALYGEGYYGGVVHIFIEGREAAGLAPDTSLPDPANVRITVDTGPQFTFGDIRIGNPAPLSVGVDDEVDPPESVGLGGGEVAKSGYVRAGSRLLLAAWRQLGHAKARLARQEVIADHATNKVDVFLEIDPGPRAAYGTVAVEGARDVDADFIARQAGLPQGAEYDPDDIRRARERLNRLAIIGGTQIREGEAVGADGLLPITIVVSERKPRRIGIGGTLSSVDGLGVETYFLHRNLLGQAETLRLDAKLAGIAWPIATANFDYAFGGTFTKPGFLTPDTDLIAAVSAERTVLPRYTELSAEARVGLDHVFSNELAGSGDVYFSKGVFDDPFGVRNFTTLGLDASATFDNRDSETDATEGFYLQATAEPFYEFEYANPALRGTVEARAYLALDPENRYVLAGRVKAGALLGPAIPQIPPDKLFFAGGGGSVRGFAYRSIGVDGPGGTITGGRFLLETSGELRARFNDTFGAVAFVDAGYVAADTFPGLDSLRVGIGAGLRYYTGLGPLRLDFAIPVNRQAGDPDYALYAGIGQAF